MHVDVTRLVAFVKAPLLLDGKATHTPAGDHAFYESIGRVIEMTTPDVGLSSVPVRPEDNRMKVHPATTGSNQLDSHRTPVGLYLVAGARQHANGGRLITCIDCEIEIAVRARLVSDKRIDAPPTSDPDRAAGFLKAHEYRVHLREIHAHQCLRDQGVVVR